MGTLNRSISRTVGLMATAIAMIFNPTDPKQVGLGYQLRNQLQNHYRGIRSTKRGNSVAAHKRAAKRLRNVRARASKRW